jgi:predicted Rossmann fold flavoprotein
MEKIYDLIVVGGGASGMIAAGRAGERGLSVLLLEKNDRLGEKLRISGGGRCNITNAEENQKLLLGKYGKAEKYLYSLFAQFGMKETFDFFESRGLPLKIEAGKRAFPQSEKAEDVAVILEAYLKKGNVTVEYHSPVTKVVASETGIESIECGDKKYQAKDYLLATGSVSHPETGSTGDGFRFLETLGHTIAPATPTIVPLAVREKWVKALMGVTLPNVKIHFFVDGKKQFSVAGDILCTHFGLSGPTILNTASRVADILHTGTVTACIDSYPSIDLGALEKNLIALFDANKNKAFKNIIKEYIPLGTEKGMTILFSQKIDITKKVHSITKEERKYIVQLLKALPVTITGLMGFDRAVVADGGIALDEVDFKTMRSKKIQNLFVTGDLLHINRPSGGYSLQLCWSSGYVAGSRAGSDEKME